jgi:hypothetical protein
MSVDRLARRNWRSPWPAVRVSRSCDRSSWSRPICLATSNARRDADDRRVAVPVGEAAGHQGTGQRPDAAEREQHADQAADQADLADQEDDQEGTLAGENKIGDRPGHDQATLERVAQNVAQAGRHVGAYAATRRRGESFDHPDAGQARRGDQEADRIGEQRHRCPHELDQCPAQARASD